MAKSPDKDKGGRERPRGTADEAGDTDEAGDADARGRDPVRTISAPSSRVNVAFPFSQIKLQEPSKELSELAALVFDLVEMMREWVPEDRMEELQARAEVLRDSLR
ncbi:MAG TPA: hypothetical protein VHD39_02755 [Acidimicrobiales bacterium]|nr:hypothetical protein [Acidimicrobiales bacterium]